MGVARLRADTGYRLYLPRISRAGYRPLEGGFSSP
jgi:hypothetical protein